MTRPEGISESAFEKAREIGVNAYLNDFYVLEIARAIQSAVEAERAVLRVQVLEAIEPYTRVSNLHNYGPGGLSRVEEAEIRTGTFIQEDIVALFENLSKGA